MKDDAHHTFPPHVSNVYDIANESTGKRSAKGLNGFFSHFPAFLTSYLKEK